MAVVLLSSGCLAVVAGAAGAGSVAWVEGRLTATWDNDFKAVTHAVDLALDQLGFAKVGQTGDALVQDTQARTGNDTKIRIHVEKLGDHLTRVDIRVGMFGDRALSTAVLEKIKANL